MTLQEVMEGLYDLKQDELRKLAYEALLISDGPDKAFASYRDDDCTKALINLKQWSRDVWH
jgi:hypothetical protein